MIFLTDFADQAVILPVVAAVALTLAAQGWWRGALAWLAVVGTTFGLMLVLKFGFVACAPVFSKWEMRSPSGHTAAAAMVVGGMAVLLTGRRAASGLLALLAAAAIGVSRIVLGFHSMREVLIGGSIGFAGAMALKWLAGPVPAGGRLSPLLVALLVAVLLHGLRLPAEAAIWHAAWGAFDFVPACRVGESPL